MNFADGKITEIQNKTISRRPLTTHQQKSPLRLKCLLKNLFWTSSPLDNTPDLICESLIPDSDFSLIKNYLCGPYWQTCIFSKQYKVAFSFPLWITHYFPFVLDWEEVQLYRLLNAHTVHHFLNVVQPKIIFVEFHWTCLCSTGHMKFIVRK